MFTLLNFSIKNIYFLSFNIIDDFYGIFIFQRLMFENFLVSAIEKINCR